MKDLIDRLTSATESSFELNSAIARLDFYREMEGDMGDDEIPDFCGSIDAALSLVPNGWHAIINWRGNLDGSSSCVLHEFPQPCRRIPSNEPLVLRARSTPLAICIAALWPAF